MEANGAFATYLMVKSWQDKHLSGTKLKQIHNNAAVKRFISNLILFSGKESNLRLNGFTILILPQMTESKIERAYILLVYPPL